MFSPIAIIIIVILIIYVHKQNKRLKKILLDCYNKSECIEFAQSVTNLEVTVYDFEQWESHEGRKVRFSDN